MVQMMRAASYLLSWVPSIPNWGSKASPATAPQDQRASEAAQLVLGAEPIYYEPAAADDEASADLLSTLFGEAPQISSDLALGNLSNQVREWLEDEQGWTPEDMQKLSAARDLAISQSSDVAEALNQELMKQAAQKERYAVFAAIPKYVLSVSFVQTMRKQLQARIAACRRMLKSIQPLSLP
jgi:hypothetical protein